ncbi:MAG: hypothetical protein ACREHD_20010, partial [Pirellulales bacterium]
CCLASFLLHLLAVLVLGSVAIPVGEQRTVVSLLLSCGELTATADDRPVELALATTEAAQEPEPEQDDRNLGHDVDAAEVPPLPETASLTELPAPRGQAEPQQAEPQQAEPQQADQPVSALGDLPSAAPPGQADEPGGAVLSLVNDGQNSEHDNVVERFIQYDIGQLRGEEGVKAREGFQRLGPDAMESLVRGLNRSASIHASCPVMVITYKIEAVLRANPDPTLLRCAVDNIGRGVPSTAPHHWRLKELLAQLRRMRLSPAGVNVTMLLAQLQSHSRPAVLEALDLILDRASKFPDFEKVELGWNCAGLLTHRDAGVRRAAHAALVALADGQDFGPAADGSLDNRFAAAGKWSRHFDETRYETAAAALLKNGEHLQNAGKRDAARRQYEKVSQEYPGTAAADDAAKLLDTLKSFAFK